MCVCLSTVAVGEAGDRAVSVEIQGKPLNHVDDRLFGQFMERASWGEPGYDAARVGQTGQLDPRVVAILKRWRVPVIRWPGGGDIRRIDWRDMIDNVPGRKGGRPVFDVSDKHPPLTNLFGVDEFLRLCEELGAEPLLPVNFGTGLSREQSLEDAARLAAGLVAYCNAPVGAKLPAGMPDWPAIRARNGHPKPYGVRYFQIGNETWIYAREVLTKLGMAKPDVTTRQRARWYLKCFNAYADAIKQVDPHVELITEWNPTGHKLDPKLNDAIFADRDSMRKARWFVRHTYSPWAIQKVTRGGEQVDPKSLTDEQIWNAWVCTPGIDPETGLASLGWERDLRRRGLNVAVTEWNWNGWWALPRDRRPAMDSDLAKGVGAAGWLHAFMRTGDVVRMACQSMTVGSRWGITGIRVDPMGKLPPRPLPAGQVTGLYSRYHGNVRLGLRWDNVPTFDQPLGMAGIKPAKSVLALDMVATARPDAVFLHVINRSFGRDLEVTVDLSALGKMEPEAVLHCLQGSAIEDGRDRSLDTAEVVDRKYSVEAGKVRVELPKRSVSVLEIPRITGEKGK